MGVLGLVRILWGLNSRGVWIGVKAKGFFSLWAEALEFFPGYVRRTPANMFW